MEGLREMARSLVVLALLTVGLETALPQGSMRPYVRAVMGLLAMLVILDPVLRLARRPLAVDPSVAALGSDTRFPTLREVEAASQRLREENEGLIARQFRERLQQAAEVAARAVPGVGSARARVRVVPSGTPLGPPQVTSVEVQVDPAPPPGEGGMGTAVSPVRPAGPVHPDPSELAAAVQSTVSEALGLPAARVLVTVRPGRG